MPWSEIPEWKLRALGCLTILVVLAGLGVGFWFVAAGLVARDWPAALGGLLVILVVMYAALR